MGSSSQGPPLLPPACFADGDLPLDMEASELLSDTFEVLSSKEIRLQVLRARADRDQLGEEEELAPARAALQESQKKLLSQVSVLLPEGRMPCPGLSRGPLQPHLNTHPARGSSLPAPVAPVARVCLALVLCLCTLHPLTISLVSGWEVSCHLLGKFSMPMCALAHSPPPCSPLALVSEGPCLHLRGLSPPSLPCAACPTRVPQTHTLPCPFTPGHSHGPHTLPVSCRDTQPVWK